MVEPAPELAIFDFDGTLFHLATDYVGLRRRLDGLAAEAGIATGGLGIHELSLRLEHDPRTGEVVAAAELEGLRAGEEVAGAAKLYRSLAKSGATAVVVTHNGAEVIEEFFRSRGLPPPAAIFDRRVLAGPKDESSAVPDYVRELGARSVLVVGDSSADRRLAERLGADFLDATAEWQ
jgi:phosphoglycolate phosphatase-like HAD superfamily hydrolase